MFGGVVKTRKGDNIPDAVALFQKASTAIGDLKKKLSVDPSDMTAAFALAEALSASGDKREAVQILSRTGLALRKKGKTLEAIAVYKKVGQVDPKGDVTATFLINVDLRNLLHEAAKANASKETPVAAVENASAAAARSAAEREKKEKDRAKDPLRCAVAGLPLLEDVPPHLLEPILEKTTLRSVNAGESAFVEGTVGQTLLFIVSGDLRVTAKDPTGKTIALGLLSAGDAAGEISFLTGVPRTATLTAISKSELLELDRAELDPILRRHRRLAEALQILYRERVLDQVLARSRLFRALPRDERDRVARRLMPLAAKAGERIVSEGSSDNVLYVIKRGEARVTAARGGAEVELATIGPNDFFGDIAALRGTTRTASVTATTAIEFLCLSKADLEDLLARHPRMRADLEAIQLERFVSNSEKLA